MNEVLVIFILVDSMCKISSSNLPEHNIADSVKIFDKLAENVELFEC